MVQRIVSSFFIIKTLSAPAALRFQRQLFCVGRFWKGWQNPINETITCAAYGDSSTVRCLIHVSVSIKPLNTHAMLVPPSSVATGLGKSSIQWFPTFPNTRASFWISKTFFSVIVYNCNFTTRSLKKNTRVKATLCLIIIWNSVQAHL